MAFSPSNHPSGQRGVVLIIALVMLVAMSLGGVAIMRSVDTSTLIAGNLAFKQRALVGTDLGVETAISWISANINSLNTDSNGAGQNGYYSSSSTTFDWQLSSSWANAKQVNNGNPDAAGNITSYVIHRLCLLPGQGIAVQNQLCATNAGAGGFESGQGTSAKGGATPFTEKPRMYLRIIVRSVGPRNSVSYAQAMVLIPT